MKNPKKIKILYLITKSNFGGAQRYVYDLATSLSTEDYEVVVALGGSGSLQKKLEDAEIKVVNIPTLQRDISIKKELQSFLQIGKILWKERPEILHVNSSKAGGIGAFLGRIMFIPKVVYTTHGWAFNEDRGLLSRIVLGFFHWLTICFSHTTISVSHALKLQMRWPWTQKKIVVIHNGRTLPFIMDKTKARMILTEHSPELAKYSNEIWTGSIAELHPVKQHERTLEALSKLKKQGVSFRHIIIGDGSLKKKLEEAIQELELTDSVFLLGQITDASCLLKAFDILLLPSRSEGFPYVLIEAMHAEVPVIASDVGGIPEIIKNGVNGLLIPSSGTAPLSQAIEKLIGSKELRAKLSEGHLTSKEQFTLKTMVEKTVGIYKTYS